MPFENATGNATAEYLNDGMTETLINSLSQIPNLKVTSRGAVFRYKNQKVSDDLIRRELNVRAILRGRVKQEDNKLLISVRLTDSQDGTQIWDRDYSGKPSDIFAEQQDIADNVTAKLRLRLSPHAKERLAKRYTDS